jgi:hypothetical protein
MPKGVASEKRCQHIDGVELRTERQGSKWLALQSAVQVHIVGFQDGKVMFGGLFSPKELKFGMNRGWRFPTQYVIQYPS